MTTIEAEVQPGEDTPIPDTPFTVYHGGDEERYVHVEDGALHLPHGDGWMVRVAAGLDLGEVAATTTEWNRQQRWANGAVAVREEPMGEIEAHLEAEALRNQVACGVPPVSVDVVSRTVTDFASGHKLIGPWEVVE